MATMLFPTAPLQTTAVAPFPGIEVRKHDLIGAGEKEGEKEKGDVMEGGEEVKYQVWP